MSTRCLAFDPGKDNFAWSAIEFNELTYKWKLLSVGMVSKTVKKMKELPVYIEDFSQEIQMLFASYQPEYVAIERFLNRGRIQQPLNELVNVMLGIVVQEAIRIGAKIGVPTASDWKNSVGQLFDLNALYNDTRKEVREVLKGHYNKPVRKKKKIVQKRMLDKPQQEVSRDLQKMVPHIVDATCIGLWHLCMYNRLDKRKRALTIVSERLKKRVARKITRRVGIDEESNHMSNHIGLKGKMLLRENVPVLVS